MWHEFKSTSKKQEVLTRPHFCGVEPGPRTIFTVEACRGYDIEKFSFFQGVDSEFEVLFRPLSKFKVSHAAKNIINPKDTSSLERSGFPDAVALQQVDDAQEQPQPAPTPAPASWSVHYSAEHKKAFFCNDTSGETTWDAPSAVLAHRASQLVQAEAAKAKQEEEDRKLAMQLQQVQVQLQQKERLVAEAEAKAKADAEAKALQQVGDALPSSFGPLQYLKGKPLRCSSYYGRSKFGQTSDDCDLSSWTRNARYGSASLVPKLSQLTPEDSKSFAPWSCWESACSVTNQWLVFELDAPCMISQIGLTQSSNRPGYNAQSIATVHVGVSSTTPDAIENIYSRSKDLLARH